MLKLACKVCASKSERLFLKCSDCQFRSKKVELFQCQECSAIFVRPQPTQKKLSSYYAQDYYNKPSFLLTIIQSLRPHFFDGLKTGKLLDVGCGSGHFLESMQKKGWKCTGTEVSDSSKPFLEKIKKNQIDVFYGNLLDASFASGSFDLISFWHVLEHLPVPSGELSYAHKILKKNGHVFIAVPNIESASFALFKCNWLHLDAPRHLNHFSPKTLSLLLEKNGFSVEKISHFSFEFNPFGVLQSIYNALGIEFNFLHRLIKRQTMAKNARYCVFIALTIVLLPILLPISVVLAYVFSLLGRGDTIGVLAQKR